ncbi:MAG TPA: preprotein translocase subunit SecG [Pyrinomonadaceae bacterium]
MLYALYTLFFGSCIVLVGAVLLQPGKTDAGALFTSNVNSNSFGPRGTATVLSKITIVAAAAFMISALMISMPAFNGGASVLNSAAAETPGEAPADANANTNSTAGSDNSNGALIQTPATDQLSDQAANEASTANTSASANATVGNTNASAPANKAKPNK